MITELINILTGFIINVISSLGYPGIALLMAIESAAIPLPSEIIMPFAGYLVSEGRFSLTGIAFAGAIGNTLGSIVTYYLGAYAGRPLIERYGKYILISRHDLDLADRFFARFGLLSTFVGRLLPVVRTFISIPAGIARVPFGKFIVYTFVGSLFWSWVLGYFGLLLGPRWASLRERAHGLDVAIVILIVLAGIWWVWRHLKHRKQEVGVRN
jgi:membrane protein DedA with SNARE-associated domain